MAAEKTTCMRRGFLCAVITTVIILIFMLVIIQPSPKDLYSSSVALVKPGRLIGSLNDGTPALNSTDTPNSSTATQPVQTTTSQFANSSSSTQQTTTVSKSQSTTPPTGTTSTQLPPAMTAFPSSKLPSWKSGSFCEDYIDHTPYRPVSVCGPKVPPDIASISCLKSRKSKYMGTCSFRNLCVEPVVLMKKQGNPVSTNSLHLLDDLGTQCPNVTVSDVKDGGDNAKRFVRVLEQAETKHHTVCEKWINKTAFFYVGDAIHVYFKTLAWYNVHTSLLNNNATAGNFIVVRLNDHPSYLFEDLERALFPGFMKLNEFPNVTTCFRKVVLSPQCWSAVPFHCKMDRNLKPSCFNCNGRGLYGSTLLTFRERVLKACSFSDLTPEQWKNKKTRNIVVLLRKFYQRWETDTPQKFQRVLSNSDELLKGLRESFPSTNVTAVHMEDMPICEQIRYAHDADVLIGVHGAGLVHLWWIQEEALILELEPMNQVGNPSFRMLSTLAGRRYQRVSASSGQQKVSVNVGDVVKKLKSVTDLN